MKKLVIISLLSAFILTSVSGQQRNQIDKLKMKMLEYAQAVEKYDTAFLEHLFDKKMIVTSASGRYRNKQLEINDLLYKTPGLTLEYFVCDSLGIVTYGKTAIITGILRWKFKEHISFTKRSFTFTFVRKRGWRIIAQHIGRIGNV